MAVNDESGDVRKVVVDKLTDPSLLAYVAQIGREISEIARNKLSNKSLLAHIRIDEVEKKVNQAAKGFLESTWYMENGLDVIEKETDPSELASLAKYNILLEFPTLILALSDQLFHFATF
jgi:hypothetical protein